MQRFDDLKAAAEALAQDIARAFAEQQVRGHDFFHLGLSGGRSPLPLFAALTRQEIQWQRVMLWFCDERAVPPQDADSNFGSIKNHLLNPLDPPPTYQRMHGEAEDLQAEAARYGALCQKYGPLDYAVLGMGTDGHTASLFPGVLEPQGVCFVARHPDGQQRLTLSSDWLNRSQQKALLMDGTEKLRVWQEASGDPQAYPIARMSEQLEVYWGA